MAVTGDIAASWLRPRPVVRRLLAGGQREDRALIFLMIGCGLIAVSQVPVALRAATLDDTIPFQARMGGVILAWLFIAPLAAYAISGIAHLLARAVGGQGSWFGARLALFWAILAASPAWLVGALAEGFLGRTATVVQAIGLIGLALFVYIWIAGLIEAEFGATP